MLKLVVIAFVVIFAGLVMLVLNNLDAGPDPDDGYGEE